MKEISAHKRKAVIVMLVVMSFHMVSGLRLFCADEFLASFRAYASETSAVDVTAYDHDGADVSPSASVNFKGKSGALPCSCKKKKKCPAIPRAAITSNPTHRPSEFQRLAKSECCDSFVPQVADLRFFTRGNTPLLELAWCSPFYSSTPLALACVLLI